MYSTYSTRTTTSTTMMRCSDAFGCCRLRYSIALNWKSLFMMWAASWGARVRQQKFWIHTLIGRRKNIDWWKSRFAQRVLHIMLPIVHTTCVCVCVHVLLSVRVRFRQRLALRMQMCALNFGWSERTYWISTLLYYKLLTRETVKLCYRNFNSIWLQGQNSPCHLLIAVGPFFWR